MINPEVLERLACPMDPSHTRVRFEESHFLCERCAVKFRIKDGIPNFVIEEAELPVGCKGIHDLPCQQSKKDEG